MKISYTGRHDVFPARPRAKFEAKLQKLSKMIDRRGEREAHVIVAQQRFLHKVEITLNAWDHTLVGNGADADVVTAANHALDTLEKQVLKLRNKWRDTTRYKGKGLSVAAPAVPDSVPVSKKAKSAAAPARKNARNNSGPKKIFRVNHNDGSKPKTLEEAMLEMEASQDYMVYRDAQTDRVTVLMRRPDGHFDLIES